MNYKNFGITDCGNVRTCNEDALLMDEKLQLFVVADGMGGHQSGEVASRMAVEILHNYIISIYKGSDSFMGNYDSNFSREANLLASGIKLANRAIFEAADSTQKLKGMGTTIVAILIKGNKVGIAHAGDSRLYLYSEKKLQQITLDHSLVAQQLRDGLITAEEATTSIRKNIITRALGQWENLEIEIQDLELIDGDRLLICSDGLTNMVNDAEIEALLNAYTNPEAACKALIEVANDYGGRDNVTTIVVDYHQPNGVLAEIGKLFGK